MIDLSILEEMDKATTKKETQEIKKENPKIHVGLDKDINDKKREIEYLTNIYENIKKSERLRAEINKDVKAGAAAEDILLKALECISLMTVDALFYEQNRKLLKK